MKNFLPPVLRNPTKLEDYLFSTFTDDWHYLAALHLNSRQVNEVPFEKLLVDNPMDVAQGVTRVETKFGTQFFDLFENLVIKHFGEDSVKLMFYTEIKNPNKPLSLYRILMAQLGGGYHFAPKFATFEMTDKVRALAAGKYDDEHDELLHSWHHGNFAFSLNFQINPLRRLVFSVTYQPKKEIDRSVRNKGTLTSLLTHDLNEVLAGTPLNETPQNKDEKVIFTDYDYALTTPEFGIFNKVEIKLNGTNRQIKPDVHSVVTYYSKFEINTDRVITLVDQLVEIYGTDDYGYRELVLHEIELIENGESWTGRNWLINQHHALQNLDNEAENTIYQVTLTLQPDDKGLNLYVIGFNTLLEYDALMKID
jgi:hypothetical protein